jgi:hypothetical protein
MHSRYATRIGVYAGAALLLAHTVSVLANPPSANAPSTPAAAPPASAASAAVGPPAPLTASVEAVREAVPQFAPGLWQYRRTKTVGTDGKPDVATLRRCGDPTGDIRESLQSLARRGCSFSPTTHQGNRYESGWNCPAPDGMVSYRSVLTVSSTFAYHEASEMHRGRQVIYSSTIATRVKGCPPGEPPKVPAPGH